MALLDFALGFGQGAAGAIAYDRKSQLDMQRQANLERLRAQYATEQKNSQVDEITRLMGQYRETNDPAIRDRLAAMGADVSAPTIEHENYIDAEGNPRVVNVNDPKALQMAESQGWIKAGNASIAGRDRSVNRVNFVNRDDPTQRRSFDLNDPEDAAQLRAGNWMRMGEFEVQGAPTIRTDQAGRQLRESSVNPGQMEIWNIGTMQWEPVPAGQAAPGVGIGEPQSRVQQIMDVNPIGNAPGVGAGARNSLGNLWAVGDILNDYTQARNGEQFSDKTAQAQFMMDTLTNRLRAAAARNIQDDGGRLSNMILELTKSETVKAGLFTSEAGLANKLNSALGELESRYADEMQAFNDPTLTPDRVIQAQNFVREFEPVIRDMKIMSNTHKMASTLINDKRVIEMTPEQIDNVYTRAINGELSLSASQIDALGAYFSLQIIDSQLRQRNARR